MAKIANMPSRESLFKPILKAMISKGGCCFVDDVLLVCESSVCRCRWYLREGY